VEHLPKIYQEFIQYSLYKEEITNKEVDILFALHNNFLNVSNPEYNKGCALCVKRCWDKVKSMFPKVEPPVEEETEFGDDENIFL
jgi:hypothetical protein